MARLDKRVNGNLHALPTAKQPVPLIGQRQMTPEHRAQAFELVLLVRHYQQNAQQFDMQLAMLLKKEYGVDASQGQWNINFDTGVISQIPGNAPKNETP